MKTVKILHTGDFHLGSLFTSTPQVANRRKIDQLTVFKNIIELTDKQKTEVLLIAGDLFDSIKVESDLLTEVKEIFALCDAEIFISPGNHDPATHDSYYLTEEWPENVHIFKSALECIELPEKNVCIWGAAFERRFQLESLLTDVTLDSSKINILVMHGELINSANEESHYNPILREKLLSAGFEYAALGHKHTAALFKNGEEQYAYCGVPEGRGFDEQGVCGVYSGNVSKNFAYMEFIPTSTRKYLSDTVDVSGCSSVNEFSTAILTLLKTRHGEDFADNLYDLTLQGGLPEGVMIDGPLLTASLSEKLHFVRITDTTSTELDIDLLVRDTSLKGAFARTISSRMQKDEKNRDKYLRALLFGIRAFDGEVKINEDN
ncbi:MAG: DNA repair exonuclease [Oscillospiraceae bacterium]|jgi:DNA repair exonuclease SbcCD nuclease subunit|nr:DNA repair exonuclease [Oscillospiraceae bacterium]